MKIALVTGAFLPHLGGVEMGAYHLAQQMRALGHSVHVITSRTPRALPTEDMVDGIPVHRLGFYLYRDSLKSLGACLLWAPAACRRYARLISEHAFDVVNVRFFYHSAFFTYLLLPLLQRRNVRVVVTLEGGDAPNIPEDYRACHRSEARALDWAAFRLLPAADAVTAVSKELRQTTLHRIPELRGRVHVIPNGVDPSFFLPGPFCHSTSIVSVGRLSREKGFDLLIRAFASVHTSLPQWRLVIVGDGPLRETLQRLVDDLGLHGAVEFKGRQLPQEVLHLLQQSAFFALASRREGCSLAALEALACGKPVLISDVGGAREMLATPALGRLAPRESVEGLEKGMRELIHRQSDFLSMGAQCRRWVERHYAWERIAPEYLHVYADTEKRRSRPHHFELSATAYSRMAADAWP